LYQADKFMLDPASAPNYVNNKDIRYEGGNEVYLYMLNRAADASVVWLSASERTLKYALQLSMATAAASVALLSVLI
jgi:hypothetical protein